MTLTPDDVRNVTFRTVRHGKRGYDEGEVDLFLDRVEATLRGDDTLTAEEVLNVEFSPRRRGRYAYAVADVDNFLDDVAQTLRRRQPRQPRPQVVAFDAPRTPPAEPPPQPVPHPGAAGQPASDEPAYDADQVDAFLGRVEATLRGQDTLSPQELLNARFSTPVPGGRAYSKSGVDAFVAQVAVSLRQLSSRRIGRAQMAPPPSAPPLTADELLDVTFSCPPPGNPAYDQQEVDAFLNRVQATLRGRDRITAHDVGFVRFSAPPPGRRGYAEEEVEALLDLVEERLQNATVRGA